MALENEIQRIYAEPGGMAERALREIAHPTQHEEARHRREFGEWREGILSGAIRVNRSIPLPVTLVIGIPPELSAGILLLRDDPELDRPRMKALATLTGGLTLPVPARMSDRQIRDFANQVVACYLIYEFAKRVSLRGFGRPAYSFP